jgi:hypothetical protein
MTISTHTANGDPMRSKKEQALRRMLDEDIKSFSDEADKHRSIYRFCASSVIALTATTTGVSAWAEMR